MRKRMIVLLVMAAIVLSTLPAQAAPWQQNWLPDADLFCQDDGDFVDVGVWTGNPNAGTLWVAEGPFAGHYLLVTTAHFGASGVLGTEPLSDEELAMLHPLGERTFGRKAGLDERVTCQVVSRFDRDLDGEVDLDPDDFTIYAPMVLAKVR
jgi:hypothetical protein